MRLTIFSSNDYDKDFFDKHNEKHDIHHVTEALDETTINLAKDSQAICVFVNDKVNENILIQLKELGIGLIALRCAGFNNVDIEAANNLNISIVNVPSYSPHSIAEHTVALILTLNRKTHKAYNRVRECNFSLSGLMGFDLYKKTAGIIGTGKIGTELAKILIGFGMTVVATDPKPNNTCTDIGVDYTDLDTLLQQSDIISLHCPLTSETNHLIDYHAIQKMKKGVMLINTSRGAALDSTAVIDGLNNEIIGYLGIDVYEQEAGMFFYNKSEKIIKDKCFNELLSFPNVLITGHQAFFTHEAMTRIVETTLQSIDSYEGGAPLINQLK